MPLSVHIVRFALFAYMESAPMRLTLIPVRDSWYSMHCLRRMPSLKASKEWCSITARTAHNRFSCSADRQMQGLYNLRRWSHWKMSLERSFRSLRLSFLVEAAECLRCLAYTSLALATSLYLLLGTRSDKILLSQES